MAKKFSITVVLLLLLGASAVRAQNGPPQSRDLQKDFEAMAQSPTTTDNVEMRFVILDKYAQKLRESGADLSGVYDMRTLQELRELLKTNKTEAAKRIDELVQTFARKGSVQSQDLHRLPAQSPATTASPPKLSVEKRVTINYPYQGYNIFRLIDSDPLSGEKDTAQLEAGKLVLTLDESPLAISPTLKKLPENIRNNAFGILGDELQVVSENAANLGYRWVKLSGFRGVNWAVHRYGAPHLPQGGEYLNKLAEQVKQAQDAGLNVLMVMEPASEKRRGAALTKQEMKTRRVEFTPAHVAEYKQFLAEVFSKLPCKFYALGNEVDIYMSPQDYARALIATYEAMKKSCANCELVTGGYLMEDGIQFFETVLRELAGRKAFDHFDMHHVFGYYDEYKKFGERAGKIRALLNAHGYQSVDIWMTETSSPADIPWEPSTSDHLQALDLIQRHVAAFDSGIRKVFWVAVMDWHRWAGEHAYFDFVGLMHNPANKGLASRRPSFYAYANLTRLLYGIDFSQITQVEVQGEAKCYRFVADSHPVYIIWHD